MVLGSANKRLGYDATAHYFVSRRCLYGFYGADYERVAAKKNRKLDIRYGGLEYRERGQCDSSIESRGVG